MRDFAIGTSRGLAAAGVLLSAVVHPDLKQGFRDIHTIGPLYLYAKVFFGLAAAAVLWQAMREHIA
jgi:hypothetical protein